MKLRYPSVDECEGHESDHLVECHASCHGAVVVADHHVPVHLFVDQTEDDGLVAHERLVVAFRSSLLSFRRSAGW